MEGRMVVGGLMVGGVLVCGILDRAGVWSYRWRSGLDVLEGLK